MLPARPILIVDDDLDIREILAETLEARGFAVVTAANGLEALRLVRSMASPPSAILLDLMMPVMDGYGFLEERGRDPVLAAVPVAIVTAGHEVDRARVGAGFPIVPKPIDLRRLVELLRGMGGEASVSA